MMFRGCWKNYEGETYFNPLSANFTKWSNTLKQFVGNLPTTWVSVFGHFVGLVLKGLTFLAPCISEKCIKININ